MSLPGQTNLRARIVRGALLLCSLTVCLAASAQRRPTPRPTTTPAPATSAPQTSAPPVAAENADLAITAHVTARELRFDAVPNPTVEFTGQPARATVWDAARQNLPRPVQPGVTYRNIGIQLVITSVFADIDRIVAEALGETPPTDDNAPPPSDTPNGTTISAATSPNIAAVTSDSVSSTIGAPSRLASPVNSTTPARSPRPRRTGRH